MCRASGLHSFTPYIFFFDYDYTMQEVVNEMCTAMKNMLSTSASSATSSSSGRIVHNKDLDKDFEDAMATEAEPRNPQDLIMPYGLKVVGALGTPAAAASSSAPSAAPADDPFWQRMQWMMDKQSAETNSRIDILGRHIAGMEGRLNLKTDKETKARQEENAAMTEAMQHLTRRVADLETRPRAEPTERGAAPGWRPAHIILGGWPRDTEKQEIERQVLEWTHALPESERGAYTRPHAPRRLSSIAKVRVDPAQLAQTAFRWQLSLEARAQQAPGAPPMWAAVERSPEMGQRRRRIRVGAEFLQRQSWGLPHRPRQRRRLLRPHCCRAPCARRAHVVGHSGVAGGGPAAMGHLQRRRARRPGGMSAQSGIARLPTRSAGCLWAGSGGEESDTSEKITIMTWNLNRARL